jgi:hypothetical protein
MRKFIFVPMFALVFCALGVLPASAQFRFAATINPLPAAGFLFDGYGIGASFMAAPFSDTPLSNFALKGSFSVMRLDMAELTDSETFSSMDTKLFMLGLSVRYYFFNRPLSGFFAGLHGKYVSSSMENTFAKVSSPYQPRIVKAEFNDILLGPELGYTFIFPFGRTKGFYIESSAGYNFTVKSGGNYDQEPLRESYRDNIPSKYRSLADWVFGKGFWASLSLGLAF